MNSIILNKYQIYIGLILLTLGCIIYITDRPPWQTHWFSDTISLYTVEHKVFGKSGGYLPSLIHVISFSLLTAGIIADKLRQYLYIIGFWILINLLFETLQLDAFHSISGFSWVKNYSSTAVFDFNDLIAIFCGGIIAFTLLSVTKRKAIRNVS